MRYVHIQWAILVMVLKVCGRVRAYLMRYVHIQWAVLVMVLKVCGHVRAYLMTYVHIQWAILVMAWRVCGCVCAYWMSTNGLEGFVGMSTNLCIFNEMFGLYILRTLPHFVRAQKWFMSVKSLLQHFLFHKTTGANFFVLFVTLLTCHGGITLTMLSETNFEWGNSQSNSVLWCCQYVLNPTIKATIKPTIKPNIKLPM